ncbi:hypothetical protein FRC05_009997 [Tulasnella sp. 425]|nr:hypothetical protein FRC05_009997 [Tulasnella sp. 425]
MAIQDRVRHESDVSHLHRLAGLSVRLQQNVLERPEPNMQDRGLESHDNVGVETREVRKLDSAPASRGVRVKCGLCERTIARAEWSRHLSDPSHARKARLATYHQALQEGTRDKLGISIVTGDLDFGIVELDSLVDWPTREESFYVQVEESGYIIKNIQMTSRLGSFVDFRDLSPLFRPGPTSTRCNFVAVTGNRGRHEDWVEITFDSPSKGIQFVIIRDVKATVTVTTHHQQLSPLGEYIHPKRHPREYKSSVPDGMRPSNFERRKIHFRDWLPEFEIPPELGKTFSHGSTESQVETIMEIVPSGLVHATYTDFWQILLWLEEYQANKDMENYDQKDTQFSVRLRRNYLYVPVISTQWLMPISPFAAVRNPPPWSSNLNLLTTVKVEVPGLAERRPSVIIGDSVLARPTNYPVGRWFRGYVHGIQQTNVVLGFHPSFDYPPGQNINVEFELNRSLLRRMHWAMRSEYCPRSTLFPCPGDVFAQGLAAPSQHDAIAMLPPGAIPFIIFGPPGTGKTVTLVESILQVLGHAPASMILVCAPSNNAADIIAGRLRNFLYPQQLFRLNAPSRAKDLPRGLESYSLRYDDGSFMVPPLMVLMQYRIVVSTCASSSLLHGVGVPHGHFTHIFVDEAGQASEPEVMIPIKLNASLKTTIVLAGDPKQLGPVIRSPVAQQLGLSRSYLERLMALPMYEVKEYRGATSSSGRDLREMSSPSWFNIDEASAVWYYVRDLRQDRSIGFEDEHIGVIAPYRAQVRKIRTILNINFPDVKVGTTEEFQGDERHAIIVSTVRSSLDFVEFDLRHSLGFVANPQRFNVAMTRAKSILIIIGDPDVLGLDSHWRQFPNHIHARGGWRGIRIPWDPTQEVVTADPAGGEELPYDAQIRARSEQDLRDLVVRASAMKLGVLDEEEEVEADADQHWRQDE